MPSMAVASVVEHAIRRTRFRFARETDLQDGLERLFKSHPFTYQREVNLGEFGTIDFVLDLDTPFALGVEVKIDGALSAVTRQLHRYCQSDKVGAVMLVTSRIQLDRMPDRMCGKEVYVVPLIGSAF